MAVGALAISLLRIKNMILLKVRDGEHGTAFG